MNLDPLSVSVVICTRDRLAELERCLFSIANQSSPSRETIVVNSAGHSAREAAEKFGTRYVEALEPGLSVARNLGASISTSDLIAFIDDDAVASPDWLGSLSKPFLDERVMAVAGATKPLGEPGALGRRYAAFAFEGERCQSVDRSHPDWFWIVSTGRLGIGTNMMFRRSAFDLWKGFDPRLGRGAPIQGAEEHMAFFQMVRSGYRVSHVPEAVVWHPTLQKVDQLRKFEIEMQEIAGAYLALLYAEYPEHRKELRQRIWRRLARGSERHKNLEGVGHPPTRIEKLRALFRGAIRYATLRKR